MSDSKQDTDSPIVAVILMAVVVVFFAVFKYFPVLILGAVFGFVAALAISGKRLVGQLKTGFLSFFFLSAVFTVLFGLPADCDTRFPGLLLYSDTFHDGIMSVISLLNGYLPNALRKFRVNIKGVTDFTISSYFWLSVYSGVVWTLVIAGTTHFFGEKVKAAGPFGALAETPARMGRRLIRLWFLSWVELGQRSPSYSIFAGPFFLIPMAAVWVILGMFADRLLKSQDVVSFFYLWLLSSFIGTAVGSLLRHIGFLGDFVSGFTDQVFQKSSPREGFVLGKSQDDGQNYCLTEKNLNYHVEIVAPTGSGKTTLLKNLIMDRISRGHGIIFIDLKAEFEVVKWALRASEHFKREEDFRLISLADRELSVPYIDEAGATESLHFIPTEEAVMEKVVSMYDHRKKD